MADIVSWYVINSGNQGYVKDDIRGFLQSPPVDTATFTDRDHATYFTYLEAVAYHRASGRRFNFSTLEYIGDGPARTSDPTAKTKESAYHRLMGTISYTLCNVL